MSNEATTYNYKVVRQFAIMTVVWGIVGMLVGFLLSFLFTPVAAQAIAIVGVNPVSGMTLITVVLTIGVLSWMFDCMDQRLFVLSRAPAVDELIGWNDQAEQLRPALISEAEEEIQADLAPGPHGFFSGQTAQSLDDVVVAAFCVMGVNAHRCIHALV